MRRLSGKKKKRKRKEKGAKEKQCVSNVVCQKSSRSANWISRGVPEPTGVIGLTMAVFKFTVLMMLPNPAGFAGLKVVCG